MTALVFFETAAKCLSFSQAAEINCVSPAAVSRQIRSLERQLGVSLFVRMNREVKLTEVGWAFYKNLQRVMNDLEVTVDCAAMKPSVVKFASNLYISMNSAFADLWMVNHLRNFRQQYSSIQTHIMVSRDKSKTVASEGVDVEIYYGNYTAKDDEFAECLMLCHEFPVCAPNLINEIGAMKNCADLSRFSLLHYNTVGYWRDMLQVVGGDSHLAELGPIFYDDVLCLNMAVAGEGVAIGDDLVCADLLRRGLLVKPLPISVAVNYGIYFVCKKHKMEYDVVKNFYHWIKSEMKQHLMDTECIRKKETYFSAGYCLPVQKADADNRINEVEIL